MPFKRGDVVEYVLPSYPQLHGSVGVITGNAKKMPGYNSPRVYQCVFLIYIGEKAREALTYKYYGEACFTIINRPENPDTFLRDVFGGTPRTPRPRGSA